MANLRNRVSLIGNLGQTPELREFESGKSKCSVSLAVNEDYKNDKGEKVEKTLWVNLEAWGKLATYLSKAEKGAKLTIEGKLSIDSYEDKEGVRKFATKILVDTIV